MQEVVANCENNRFDIEIALDQHVGLQNLPFPGMDKSGSAICTYYLKDQCQRGPVCPLRHTLGNQNTVCKHWLRGLCKKGDSCEFLHEYDMSKMPECYFYARLGQCCNKECPFLHIDPDSKIKDCPWFDRGFCRHGPSCKHRHVRRIICPNYLFGFCLDGKQCKYVHPRFELPTIDLLRTKDKPTFNCHTCGEQGHKAAWCLKKHLFQPQQAIGTIGTIGTGVSNTSPTSSISSTPMAEAGNNVPISTSSPTSAAPQSFNNTNTFKPYSYGGGFNQNRNPQFAKPFNNFNNPDRQAGGAAAGGAAGAAGAGDQQLPDNYVPGQRRPLDQVTCYKCGDKGHYANRCPKGHLAFLHLGTQQT